MRPALSARTTTRGAKPSNCLLRHYFLELENNTINRRKLFTSNALNTQLKPQFLLPTLSFLVTRSYSSRPRKKGETNVYKQYQPRNINKFINPEEMSQYFIKQKISKLDMFASLRSALYSFTMYDTPKTWQIYQLMKKHGVDQYLQPNHYGRILSIMKYGKAVPDMLSVLEDMKAHHKVANAQHISQILFAMSRQGLVRAACDLIRVTTAACDRSTNPDRFYPTANHYDLLVISLKNNKTRDATVLKYVTQLLIKAMEKHNTVLENTTVSQMLSILSKRGASQLLTVSFLKSLDKVTRQDDTMNHPYNVYIYTTLIAGFARKGDSKGAISLLKEMERQKVEPNIVTSTVIINAHAVAGDFDAARKAMDLHIKKYNQLTSTMVTSLLINALRKNNIEEARKAVSYVQKMDTQHLDNILRTALLWLKSKQDVDEAQKEFDDLKQQNEKLVNSVMANHLLVGYGKRGDKAQVYQSYAASTQLATTAEAELRAKHHLTHALFQCRDVSAAMQVFASIRSAEKGVPDDVTLAMVIQGLLLNKEGPLAWRLFKTMLDDGIEPNLHAYSSILKALAHSDSDLKKRRKHSEVDLEPALAAAGIRHQNADYSKSPIPVTTEAHNLFRRLTGFQKPNVYTYTTLISCFAKHDIAQATSIFEHMCANKSVKPTVETYTALLQGCAIFRKGELALRFFTHMNENHVEPNAVTWRYLLKSLLRSHVDKNSIDEVGAMARKSIDRKTLEKKKVINNA
ncbi:hypothetical protein [Parasitella parasitica]|uniref:Pentacotripeptide-repeat region of PRORP domain-containing protein n=1 Tax=Parasitella parasitica TaxID=35722 RepID=A0A0B7MW47_9FUNG|nr:hypothetical protein [Parasitella parasitica]